MSNLLPGYDRALRLLSTSGEFITPDIRAIASFGGVKVDTTALSGVGRVLTNHAPLAQALNGITAVDPLSGLIEIMQRAHQNRGLVWGFSGYASPGYDYSVATRGMKSMFGCLAGIRGGLPSLMVYGAVSQGALGIATTLAERYQVPRLGFGPLGGLDSIGPSTYLVAHKRTYREREVLVGTAADVLACMDGAQGTYRECEWNLNNGGTVVIIALQPDSAYNDESVLKSYHRIKSASQALSEGRLIICRHIGDIQVSISKAVRVARLTAAASRRQRFPILAQELAS